MKYDASFLNLKGIPTLNLSATSKISHCNNINLGRIRHSEERDWYPCKHNNQVISRKDLGQRVSSVRSEVKVIPKIYRGMKKWGKFMRSFGKPVITTLRIEMENRSFWGLLYFLSKRGERSFTWSFSDLYTQSCLPI